MTLAGLVLAAGEGSRLGTPKALVRLGGQTLAERAVATLRAGGCASVHVVVGAAEAEVDAEVVRNAEWRTGMGSSLRAGLVALPRHADVAVVVLVDQPLVSPEAVRRVAAAVAAGADAARATYDGVPGHPVAFARRVWADVAATLSGDEGARAWLRAHADMVRDVDCTGVGSPVDVDTADTLAALAGDRVQPLATGP